MQRTTLSVFSADKATVKRLQGQLARVSKSEDFEDDTGMDEDDEDEEEGHIGEEKGTGEDGGVEGSLTAAGDDELLVDDNLGNLRELFAFFSSSKSIHSKGASENNVRIRVKLLHPDPDVIHAVAQCFCRVIMMSLWGTRSSRSIRPFTVYGTFIKLARSQVPW